MVQSPIQPTSAEQRFVHAGVTWKGFKTIQTLFESPGVRVVYFQGEVELSTVSELHGIIAGNLGYLLEMYMTELDLDFFGTEDFSIETEAIASAQADKSYSFDERKSIPDLAVEIVITGERETKLKRYAALGVPEVWFWIEGQLKAYRLDAGRYTPIQNSTWLPKLDLQQLAACAAIELRKEAIKAFVEG